MEQDYAHHFSNAEHEYVSSKQGMWLFLLTEVVMFGGLFVGFAYYNSLYPEIFEQGASFLDWKLGALNTVILITSSFTMAMAIYYVQKGNNKMAKYNLIATLLFAFGFLIVKGVEYSHKIHDGLLPGKFFSYEGDVLASLPMYFGFYFTMTGIHGIHVIIGMCLIGWMIFRTHRGDFHPKYYTALECVGLFWHLVDLVWIYLFPLLYLVG